MPQRTLGDGLGSGYPGFVDAVQTYQNTGSPVGDSASRIDAEYCNDALAGVVAIETILGVNPEGAYATVLLRLNGAAYLTDANTFTANQMIANTAPTLTLSDTTASAKDLVIKVDADKVQFREAAGADGTLLVIDLATLALGIRENPIASCALSVGGTTGAFLPPRLTTTQRDALTPTNGMLVYNSTTGAFNYRKAGAWVAI